MRKCGQMEIFGFLVIIIMLLVLGVLYLRFALTPSQDIVSESRTALEVSDFLAAAMKYTPCSGSSLEDAVKSCQNNGIICGEDACGLLEKELNSMIIAYNLEVWQGKYEGYSLEIGEIRVRQGELEGVCLADSYKISTPGGLVLVNMKLCS